MKKYNVLFALMAALVITGCSKNDVSSSTKPSSSPSESEVIDYTTIAYSTHAEYMNAESGAQLKVKGVVTAISGNKSAAFIQDGADGYHIYDSATVANMEVGKTYTIVGGKAYYNGAHEISHVVYINEESTACTYTVTDISDKNFANLQEMSVYHGSQISMTGVVIKNIPSLETEKGFNVLLTLNEKEIQLRVDPSNLSADDFAAAKALLKNCSVGQAIDFKGVMSAFGYSGVSPQIILLDVSSMVPATLDNESLIANAISTLNIPYTLKSGTTSLNLPTSVEGSEVSIAWASSDPSIIAADGTVTQPENDTVVTLTATVTLQDASDNEEFKVNVIGSVSNATLAYTETFTHANFEVNGQYGQSGIKQGYADGVAEFTENYRWMFNSALHGKNAADHSYVLDSDPDETWCARIKPTSASENAGIYTFFTFENLAYVDFYVAGYGTYTGSICTVSYSIDGGTTWVATETTFKTTAEATYTRAYINQTAACQVKFSFENSNASATSNIDYVQFYTSNN